MITGNTTGYLRLDLNINSTADLSISMKGVMDGKERDDLAKSLNARVEAKLVAQNEMLSNINDNLQVIINHLRQITDIESEKGEVF